MTLTARAQSEWDRFTVSSIRACHVCVHGQHQRDVLGLLTISTCQHPELKTNACAVQRAPGAACGPEAMFLRIRGT